MHWGILAEGLTEFTARRCADVLNAAGLPVDVLADACLFAMPERVELRTVTFNLEGLTYSIKRQSHCIAWDNLVYLDVARLQIGKTEAYTDSQIQITVHGMIPRSRVVETHGERLTTDFPLHLDVIAREPWTWLRMSLERFLYGSTGLPVRPTRKVNFHALALELANRAWQASTGPGYKTIAPDGSLHTQEALSEEAWRHRLRWRLSQIENRLR
jgi:hypothetical protein